MSSRRSGLLAAALVCTLAPLTAGCGADFTAGTRLVRPDTPTTQLGDIKIQNAVVVAAEDQPRAVLTVALINEGDQAETLDAVAVEDAGQVQVSGGRITIPARGAVFIGSADGPSVTITRAGGKPAVGDYAELRLSFTRAGEARLQVPVLPPTGAYSSLTPSAETSPPPGGTGTPAGTGTPTGTSSPTGTEAPGSGGAESPATGVEEGQNSATESPSPTP